MKIGLAIGACLTFTARVAVASPQVELVLKTDKATYHVGEATHLSLSVKNITEARISGYMVLDPSVPQGLRTSALLYRRDDGEVQEFRADRAPVEFMNMIVPTVAVEPGARFCSEFVIAVNPKTGRMVLDQPGEFEIRWETWGIPAGMEPAERLGISTHVRVLPVPEAEGEAFTAYASSGLARLVQSRPARGVVSRVQRESARHFLEQYPQSLYASRVRRGLIDELDLRVLGNKASADERQLLGRLRLDLEESELQYPSACIRDAAN